MIFPDRFSTKIENRFFLFKGETWIGPYRNEYSHISLIFIDKINMCLYTSKCRLGF